MKNDMENLNDIKKIGVIGLGKMGKEIFSLFFDAGYHVIGIDVNSQHEFMGKLQKNLDRSLDRKIIDEKEYYEKKSSFSFSSDMNKLKDCNLIIEAVYEDLLLKQRIFKELNGIVSNECIIATNTSSIPLNETFKYCTNLGRCVGLHFFYPIKIMDIVEINKLAVTSSHTCDLLVGIFNKLDKKYIIFNEKSNMFINKILCILTTQAYLVCNYFNIGIIQLDEIIKKEMLLFGVFEIVDSVGLNIISESIKNFTDDRYKNLFAPFLDECNKLISKGYTGGLNEGINDYYKDHVTVESIENINDNGHMYNVLDDLYVVLINEIVYIINHYEIHNDKLIYAVSEVLGLRKNLKQVYEEIGYKKYKDILNRYYDINQWSMYIPLVESEINETLKGGLTYD